MVALRAEARPRASRARLAAGMSVEPDKADPWPTTTACHSTQLRRYMSKGFSVVFRLYDTAGNLRVTYGPVNIGACGY